MGATKTDVPTQEGSISLVDMENVVDKSDAMNTSTESSDGMDSGSESGDTEQIKTKNSDFVWWWLLVKLAVNAVPGLTAFVVNYLDSDIGTVNVVNGIIVLFWFCVLIPYLLSTNKLK